MVLVVDCLEVSELRKKKKKNKRERELLRRFDYVFIMRREIGICCMLGMNNDGRSTWA